VGLFICLTWLYRVVFVVYHHDIFANLTLWEILYALFWGIRFDLAIAMSLGLCCLLLSRLSAYRGLLWYQYALFFMPLFMVTQTADTLYFQDSGRHLSFDMLSAGGGCCFTQGKP